MASTSTHIKGAHISQQGWRIREAVKEMTLGVGALLLVVFEAGADRWSSTAAKCRPRVSTELTTNK